MKNIPYSHWTAIGSVWIEQSFAAGADLFTLWHKSAETGTETKLGTYMSAEKAAQDLVSGHFDSEWGDFKPSAGVPWNLRDWNGR